MNKNAQLQERIGKLERWLYVVGLIALGEFGFIVGYIIARHVIVTVV